MNKHLKIYINLNNYQGPLVKFDEYLAPQYLHQSYIYKQFNIYIDICTYLSVINIKVISWTF